MPERSASIGEWEPGTTVVVRSPGSWADGRIGVIVGYLGDWVPPRVTVELHRRSGEKRRPRYLSFDGDLRTYRPRPTPEDRVRRALL